MTDSPVLRVDQCLHYSLNLFCFKSHILSRNWLVVKVIWLRSSQNSPKTAGPPRCGTGNMRGSVSSFPVACLEVPAGVPRGSYFWTPQPQASSRDVLVPAEPNDPYPPFLPRLCGLKQSQFFWCWTPLKSHNMRSHLNLMMLVHQVGGDLQFQHLLRVNHQHKSSW